MNLDGVQELGPKIVRDVRPFPQKCASLEGFCSHQPELSGRQLLLDQRIHDVCI